MASAGSDSSPLALVSASAIRPEHLHLEQLAPRLVDAGAKREVEHDARHREQDDERHADPEHDARTKGADERHGFEA